MKILHLKILIVSFMHLKPEKKHLKTILKERKLMLRLKKDHIMGLISSYTGIVRQRQKLLLWLVIEYMIKHVWIQLSAVPSTLIRITCL